MAGLQCWRLARHMPVAGELTASVRTFGSPINGLRDLLPAVCFSIALLDRESDDASIRLTFEDIAHTRIVAKTSRYSRVLLRRVWDSLDAHGVPAE